MVGDGVETRGERVFSRLARAVVSRPIVPIVAWLLLLAVAVPFLGHLGAVTTNSTETLPANAPSALAEAKLAQLFPNESGGASAIVLLYGPNLTDAAGQSVVMNLTARLAADRPLADVSSVASVYTSYASYLAGQAQLAGGAIAAAQHASPTLANATNQTAELLWGPPALYLATWWGLVNGSNASREAANAPAYNATAAELANSSAGLAVLRAFYAGYPANGTGFSGLPACANASSDPGVVACADAVARTNLAALVPSLPGANATVASAVLRGLGTGNATDRGPLLAAAADALGSEVGLAGPWVDTVWTAFPGGSVPPGAARAFANTTVAATTLGDEPVPVPPGLLASFVSPAGTASLVVVTFSVSDEVTNGAGQNIVYADLGEIAAVTSEVLATSQPLGTIGFYLTGGAALDQLTAQSVDASLALVLPLTVGLLLGIAMLYFRSPIAPLVAFGGLAVALLLGLGATVLLGTLVTHIDSTALTLEEVFVLGVGTDYSIFLLARYREELVRGRPSEEAIVTAVTWAGQSIATSGSTAIIVTAALAFSGVALLSQWGMVLSLAILVTMLVALTLLPALLRLVGPRLFWPTSGARFERLARASNARAAAGTTYFYRVARAAERRPGTFVAAVAVVTIPLVAIALQVPVSYDFYGQLPGGHGATDGLAELGAQFGPGFAVPSFALVTFAAPLAVGNATNASEFSALAALTSAAADTPGISSVRSPIGPYGANLSTWVSLGSQPSATRANLLATLASYVGTDGRTVLLQLQPAASGLSAGAVAAVGSVEQAFRGYAAGHPAVVGLAFGGGAPGISDIAAQTDLATEVMLVAVTIGLVLVLLLVLRSLIIALLAVATIGVSIAWAWALTDLVFQQLAGLSIFFYVRTILIMLVLGLGIDYNIFLLTRIREERLRGRPGPKAIVEAVGRTGAIITAAAVILACAFAALLVGDFTLIRAIGFAVAVAVVLDAMVVRTYLVPASLQLLGERAWTLSGRKPRRPAPAPGAAAAPGNAGLSP